MCQGFPCSEPLHPGQDKLGSSSHQSISSPRNVTICTLERANERIEESELRDNREPSATIFGRGLSTPGLEASAIDIFRDEIRD